MTASEAEHTPAVILAPPGEAGHAEKVTGEGGVKESSPGTRSADVASEAKLVSSTSPPAVTSSVVGGNELAGRAGASATTPEPDGASLSELQQPPETVGPQSSVVGGTKTDAELVRRTLEEAAQYRNDATAGLEWDGGALAALSRLVARNIQLEEGIARAAYVAEHLVAMMDRDAWRATGGDDGQGHYEGDYHAEKVDAEIKEWRALALLGEPAGRETQDE